MKSNGKGPAGRRERRAFSAEFKAEAVRLMSERRAEGVSLAQVGRELDIRPDQLRAWAKQLVRDSGSPPPAETPDQAPVATQTPPPVATSKSPTY